VEERRRDKSWVKTYVRKEEEDHDDEDGREERSESSVILCTKLYNPF
jgi:hypothetical protein